MLQRQHSSLSNGSIMRRIGHRKEPCVTREPSAACLASGVAFSCDIARLAGGRFMFPKGVFRYKSHDEANAHAARCLAEGMARLALDRTVG